MAYFRVYKRCTVQLVSPLIGQTLTYEVTYKQYAPVQHSLEAALEIAVSEAKQFFGGAEPAIHIEHGARGTVTAVELTSPTDIQVYIAGEGLTFCPSIIIRSDLNPIEFTRVFAFTNPCPAFAL